MSQTKAQLVQPVGIVTGTGINVTGVITATSFVGSGEGLTGVASTDNIITGTAATFNNTVQVNSTLTSNSGFTTNATNANLKVTGITTLSDDVTFTGAAANVTWDKSTDDLIFNDNAQAAFGTGSDLTIYHNGTDSYIKGGSAGELVIRHDAITMQAASSTDTYFDAVYDGAVSLRYNNSKKIETMNTGVAVVGVMSATTYSGDGSGLTGVGDSIAPWHYNPDISETNAALVPVDTGIGITFNKKVVAGSGTATLKIVNAGTAGTTVQSWGVSSCTFATTVFSLGSLVSDLEKGRTYQIDIPATFIDDSGGKSYVGTAWTFATSEQSSSDDMVASNLWGWGANPSGALGQNNTTNYSSPRQVPGTTWGRIARASYYANHSAFVKTDNTLWIWGNGTDGQLGLNSAVRRSSPTQLPGTTWVASTLAYQASFAVKTDGTLWAWGRNTGGVLGQNSTTDYSSPIQVGSDNTWAITNSGVLAAGYTHMLAIKDNGTLWGWGTAPSGQLGHPEMVTVSSPIQITSASNWKYVSADVEKSAAINTDGELWVWGKNQHGQLGMNAGREYQSSPIQVPGTWTSFAFGDDQGMAIRANGTLFTFGNNSQGQLGQNNLTQYSSPVQVPGTTWSTDITACAQGSNHAVAMKSDGTAWGWGNNGSGQFGTNNNTQYSSPVQMHSSNDNIREIETRDYGTFSLDT